MNSFHGLTLLSFASLHLFIYCQKLLTPDRYIKRSWEQFVSVSASSHYSWVHSEFRGVKSAFVFGGAGFCMAHPLSESSFSAQTLTHFGIQQRFSAGFASRHRFCSGHQVATQYGAKIVYCIKVNVNGFNDFSTVSMFLRRSVKFHSVLL